MPSPSTSPPSTATSSARTIFEKLRARYDVKEQILGPTAMRYHERIVMLSVLDGLWKDHLLAMDHLKEGIGLRGYAQQDPLVAYKKESFDMFEAMMLRFQEDTSRHLFRMQIIGPDGTPIETPEQLALAQAHSQAQQAQQTMFENAALEAVSGLPQLGPPPPQAAPTRPAPPQNGNRPPAPRQEPAQQPRPVAVPTRQPSTTIDALEKEFQRKKQRELDQARAAGSATAASNGAPRATGQKVGRNEPCPCGSGKKYKACHGANA